MKKEELEALRQELDRQGCDTYMGVLNEEHVSYISAGGSNFYGFNIDFGAIADRCYRSDNRRVKVILFENDEQSSYYWSIFFERGEGHIDLTVHPLSEDFRAEIIGVDCLLKVFPELVAYAQKYLARNWKRITNRFYKKEREEYENAIV